jgi:hypothetical protein
VKLCLLILIGFKVCAANSAILYRYRPEMRAVGKNGSIFYSAMFFAAREPHTTSQYTLYIPLVQE